MTLGYIKDNARGSPFWTKVRILIYIKGPTTLLETGFNPGIISHCVKRGLEDCAKYYIENPERYYNINDLRRYLN